MVTINDIAKQLGVAKSTVSNALTGRRYVNPELKEKILATVKEMQFEPNFFATTLSNKKMTNIVGLFLELGTNKAYQSFYHQLIESCIVEASNHDYNVLVYFGMTAKQTSSLLKVGKSPIDCAILLSPELEDSRTEQIEAARIPSVYIGKPEKSKQSVSFVDTDNYGLVATIVEKLYSLGHKRIVFINSKKDLTISKERYDAFMTTSRKHELNFEPIHLNATFSNEKEGFDLTQKCLNEGIPFTAIITANDLLAKGVYDCLAKNQLAVGDDVSVVALGGDVYIHQLKPALSYAYQDYHAIGKMATNIVLKQIESDDYSPTQFEIKSKVHYLGSLKEAPKR